MSQLASHKYASPLGLLDESLLVMFLERLPEEYNPVRAELYTAGLLTDKVKSKIHEAEIDMARNRRHEKCLREFQRHSLQRWDCGGQGHKRHHCLRVHHDASITRLTDSQYRFACLPTIFQFFSYFVRARTHSHQRAESPMRKELWLTLTPSPLRHVRADDVGGLKWDRERTTD